MKTLTVMREEVNQHLGKVGEIRATCRAESRDPSKEERQNMAHHLDQVEELEKQIALEERTQNIISRVEKPKGEVIKPDPNSHSRIEVGRDEQETRDKFHSFGEMLVAVRRACSSERSVDPRLITTRASGLNEGVGADGGFLVQTEHATGLLKNVWENGEIPKRLNKITLGGAANSLSINGLDETSRANGSRAGGIVSYWKGEAESATGSKPKFRQIDLKLNKLIGLCYATDELLADATALESVISTGFQSEFDFRITDAVINGTGAGQPLGIMNAGSLVTVAKESGQTADTVKYENICKMWARMIASSRRNAVWIINQDIEPQLFTMSLAVGTAGGGPVYLPPGGASASPYGTLFGRPVIAIEQAQTLGDKGDIMLCDFGQYVAIDKGAMKKDVSMHVKFVEDEAAFRFTYRFDGQPVLASAITPKNGTNTLSHFVALANRA
ncbi:phage major capsid protein [Desulfuromonas thiophila]|uniref:Phage major capsid protein, HK97 family n=1 Tax=Desulfuromonas thiophila TaxID=57664 RepID=A0A1G7B1P3_9BACT|nr:phage major capsid protein [Desulfuromonas thiophila]SDE21044.1 phage major capsid protein, HK97 family [Desulfuromonas thiophila]